MATGFWGKAVIIGSMPHSIDRGVPKPLPKEYISLTLGYLWRGFETLSDWGYSLELFPDSKAILLEGQRFAIVQTTIFVGAAPLLDLSNFLPEKGPSLAIVIDPDAERISHGILLALARGNIADAVEIATNGHQQYLDPSESTYLKLQQAYLRLKNQLNKGHFVHLLPFQVESAAAMFRKETPFADRVVCLFPSITLPMPSLFELTRRVLRPGGELILQTDSEDIFSIAVETAPTQGFWQQPFTPQRFVSLYSIAGSNKRVYTLSFKR